MTIESLPLPKGRIDHINNLTGLRGYAVIVILLFHSAARIFEHGYLAVDVFFVLSGFIITYIYQESFTHQQLNWGKYKSFLIKRLARIYPIHIFSLLIFLTSIIVSDNLLPLLKPKRELDITTFLEHIFLIQNWGLNPGLNLNFPSWSVSVEWFAYIFLSVPCIILLKNLSNKLVCLVAALAWLISLYLSQYLLVEYSIVTIGILRIIPAYIAGYCVFRFYRSSKGFIFPGILPLICIFLFGYLFFGDKRIAETLIVPASALLIYTLAKAPFLLDIFFSNRISVYLGKISYSVYLLHIPMYNFTRIINPAATGNHYYIALYILFVLMLTLAASHFAYKYIEEPFRKKLAALA